MDVAITGASGLIGRALAARLSSTGHQVRKVSRSASSGSGDIHWDPATGTIDPAAFEGVNALVHLAGEGIAEKRWSPEQKERIADSRRLSTDLLARTLAGLQHPPTVLLSGSAIGYYGERGDELLTESSGPGDGFLTDVCVAWEAATQPAQDAGIRVAHLRTGIVLDRKAGALGKMLPLFRFGVGGRLGNGRQYWSWISLDDEIAAICWLLMHDVSGAVNLTAPNPVTNAEFTKALAQELHRPAIFPVPRFGPKLLLGKELADSLLFTSARVQPEALTQGGYEFAHPTLPEALRSVLRAGKDRDHR